MRPESVEERAARLRFRRRRFTGCESHVRRLTSRLRLVQRTDLHVGRVTPEEVQWTAVELTNAAHPDLVCLTGDYVARSLSYLGLLEEIVRAIEAPTLAVMGNHDHWAGVTEVRAAIERGGAAVLSNAHTTVALGGQRLQVVGLDDAHTGHADPERALRGLDPSLPTIGLAHIPESAEALWAGGVPLVLSGHTHGGQITVARLNEIALGRLGGHRFVHGLYGRRVAPEAALYVSAGIGSSVMPLRLGRAGQREITLFDLGLAPGSIPEPLLARPATDPEASAARRLRRRHRRRWWQRGAKR
jgi:predicted MPP superfamily phosphohydrolase